MKFNDVDDPINIEYQDEIYTQENELDDINHQEIKGVLNNFDPNQFQRDGIEEISSAYERD